GNTIDIFEEPKKLRKKINSIKTDSKSVEEPKDPTTDSVFTLYKLFATPAQQEELASRYRAGGMGYGEAKSAWYEAAMAHFAEARERREKLAADPSTVEDILREGAAKARAKAQEVVDRVRSAVGLECRL